MTKKEIVNQLEDLKEHCMEMISEDETDSIWIKDVKALEEAIKYILE